jgi:hypothetical protein
MPSHTACRGANHCPARATDHCVAQQPAADRTCYGPRGLVETQAVTVTSVRVPMMLMMASLRWTAKAKSGDCHGDHSNDKSRFRHIHSPVIYSDIGI